MTTGPVFTGSGTTAATANDFLKDVRLGFAGRGATDAEKLEEVGDRFRHGSPADVWFKANTFTTWKDFVKAFEGRFAQMAPIAKPRGQLMAELSGMRIAMGQLAAEYVLIDGVKIAPMVEFRARVREAVLDAKAGTETEGVWAFHAALPAAIRLAVGAAPANWDAMLVALDNVPQHAVDMEVREYQRAAAVDAKLGELNSMMQKIRVAATGAPQSLTTPPLARTPNVAPQNVTPAPNAGANPGAGGGGVGRGAGRPRGAIGQGTDQQKATLLRLMTEGNSRQPPDTPEGRARYNEQIAEWERNNVNVPPESVAIWSTGYPISPGTALPCSGECWRCGVFTQQVHQVCPRPLVPPLERKYRATCGTWLRRIHYPAQVVNLVEVAEVEGVPWFGGGEAQTNANANEGAQDF